MGLGFILQGHATSVGPKAKCMTRLHARQGGEGERERVSEYEKAKEVHGDAKAVILDPSTGWQLGNCSASENGTGHIVITLRDN